MGSASYAPEKDALIWKIKSFPGGKVRFTSNFSASAVYWDMCALLCFPRAFSLFILLTNSNCSGIYA